MSYFYDITPSYNLFAEKASNARLQTYEQHLAEKQEAQDKREFHAGVANLSQIIEAGYEKEALDKEVALVVGAFCVAAVGIPPIAEMIRQVL